MPKIRMRDGSGEFRLKYLVEDVDRHGNVRIYFRRPGHRKIRLRERPGTQAFIEEYWRAARDQSPERSSDETQGAALKQGSFRWLCIEYFGSAGFQSLAPRTQTVRRQILEGVCVEHAAKPAKLMEARHVRKIRDEKAHTPAAANALVKALRQLFRFAIEYDFCERNPALEVSYLSSNSGGFHAWTPEEVRQFEDAHPIGSKARLAMALLLYTGQRRSDVVRLGPQHVSDGWLRFTQAKNRGRKPVDVAIPILPELQRVIDATPTGHLAFLTTQFGKPFTANGFGNFFRKMCDQAGLPHCSAHGLRKAGAARAAENGATEHQLMAIFGWKTIKEAERYTRSARQKVLAESGMPLLATDQTMNKKVPLSSRKRTGGTKTASKSLRKLRRR